MREINMTVAQRALTLISGAIKGVTLYPAAHPAALNPIRELNDIFAPILAEKPDIRIGIIDGVLFLEHHLFFTPNTAIEEVTNHLLANELRAITFKQGLPLEELKRFITLIAQRNVPGNQLGDLMLKEGIQHIHLELSSDAITDDEEDYNPLTTYSRALNVVNGLFREIEHGRIPNSGELIDVVDRMVAITIKDPSTLLGLTMIKDYDNYTFNHSVNVGVLSMALGAALGLDRNELEELGVAGLLHDVGKTRVEKTILNKPGKLSTDEFEIMKTHSENGARIISKMEGLNPRVAQAVLGHHIRFNRTGYPEWARNLPFDRFCDIVAVADCYDAITTIRAYKSPLNPKAALDKLRGLAGGHLDSTLVDKFTEMMGKYPVGTLVRLDTNEIAVVYRPDPLAGESPTVKTIIDETGKLLESPDILNLAEGNPKKERSRIVAVVDPLLKNINIAEYLD